MEKKPGVRKIHQLRIIGLLEADFNTALKLIFAKNKRLEMQKVVGLVENNGVGDRIEWQLTHHSKNPHI